MAHDWDIKPRGHACRACGEAFADRDECSSVLTYTEEGYVRGDYCTACWSGVQIEGSPISTGLGRFLAPPPKAVEALNKETAESLLRRLMEDEDDTNTNVIYILAVMLERKRILVERDVKPLDDGRLLRVYEQRKTGETFLITEPRLQLDQLEGVQQEVVAMLGGGPEKKGEGEEPAADAVSGTADAGPEDASSEPTAAEATPAPAP
jgi:hypothetical protein